PLLLLSGSVPVRPILLVRFSP
ncbi:hypothetical protein CCACVL1_01793, partial [Corchorus capsularis]